MVTVQARRGTGPRIALGAAVVVVTIASMVIGLLIGPEARVDQGDLIAMGVLTAIAVLLWGFVLWLDREPDAGNRAALGAVVVGAFGVATNLVFFFGFPLVLGAGAIVLGRDGLTRADAGSGRRGAARAGVVLGVLALVLWVAAFVVVQEW